MAGDSNLNDPDFERTVTLRDAYRILEQFVSGYHASDFLKAARAVLDAPEDNRAR